MANRTARRYRDERDKNIAAVGVLVGVVIGLWSSLSRLRADV